MMIAELETLVDEMLRKDTLIRELRALLVVVDAALDRGGDFQCGPKGRHSTLRPAIKAAIEKTSKFTTRGRNVRP